jgi:hypothetical protein
MQSVAHGFFMKIIRSIVLAFILALLAAFAKGEWYIQALNMPVYIGDGMAFLAIFNFILILGILIFFFINKNLANGLIKQGWMIVFYLALVLYVFYDDYRNFAITDNSPDPQNFWLRVNFAFSDVTVYSLTGVLYILFLFKLFK